LKKFLSIALVVLMVAALVLSFSGCTTDSSDDTTDVKIGYLYLSVVDDGGWTEAQENGRQYMMEELGLVDGEDVIYKENVEEEQGEVEDTIRDMIDQGCNVIIGTSFGFGDGMLAMAEEYPDVIFLHATGVETADNLGTFFAKIYQTRYLSGIVAGLATETNEIGYVAAFPIPEVIRGINAFALGVQSVNPDAVVNVTWTNSWYDPTTEKEAAAALIEQGCDVTAQHQDSTATMEAAAEAGILSIGYDLSAAETMPEVYMTAPVFDWGPYYVEVISEIQNGTWESSAYWGDITTGMPQLDALTDLAPEGAQDAVDEAEAALMDGSLVIFEGEIKDQDGNVVVEEGTALTDEELLSMTWLVEGVNGTVE
jgi:basic membrane protein A